MGDPLEFLRSRYDAIRPPPVAFGDAESREGLRAQIGTLIGAEDEPWEDPWIERGSEIDEGGYVRCWASFPSRHGWRGSGWLLVPKGLTEPAPAVICLPGHGAGADAIVGLGEDSYQANFALSCVQRGWVSLAVEQVSFGRNKSPMPVGEGSSCHLDSLFALELGETMTGWRVRDAMAAARALRTMPEVDSPRIATLGISGGGLTALWTASVDESILAVGASGYFCSMSHSILRFRHCPDNYVPGLARLLDVPDLAALVAPRWLAVESGLKDTLFAIEGFRDACERARAIYSQCARLERFASSELDSGHVFNGCALFEHFERAFASGLGRSVGR